MLFLLFCFKLTNIYLCFAFSAFTLPPYITRPELQDTALSLTFPSLLMQQGLSRERTPEQKLPGLLVCGGSAHLRICSSDIISFIL